MTVTAIDNKFDASLIVIWFVALFCILSGAMWSRSQFIEKLNLIGQEEPKKEMNKNLSNSNENLVNVNNLQNKSEPSEETKVESDQIKIPDSRSKFIDLAKDQNVDKVYKKPDKNEDENKNLVTLSISFVSILFLLTIVVCILLLLYFFYNQMSKFNNDSQTSLIRTNLFNINLVRIIKFESHDSYI